MHIDYSKLLPSRLNCDHRNVTWESNEPNGASYVLVSVKCQDCPSSVSNVRVDKRKGQ